jgi:site-specific recombinase XerD
MPGSGVESWTLLDREGVPVGPVEGFLGFLSGIERSPNTVKAYAHDLKDLFVFLRGRGRDWREVCLEDLGQFVAWLRLPAAGREGRVLVLPGVTPALAASSVNRKLSAVGAFYEHQARGGVNVGGLLAALSVPGRRGGSFKPFLHHISKNSPQTRRAVGLKAPRALPRVLTAGEAQAILDACDRLRDRVLFAVLWDTGMRIGEALGLRHGDIAAAERENSIVPRTNENGAREHAVRAHRGGQAGSGGLRPQRGGAAVRPVRHAQCALRQGEEGPATAAPQRPVGDGLGGGGGGRLRGECPATLRLQRASRAVGDRARRPDQTGGDQRPVRRLSRCAGAAQAARGALCPTRLRHPPHRGRGGPPRFIQQQVGHESDSSTAIYTHVSNDFMNTMLRKALAPALAPTASADKDR